MTSYYAAPDGSYLGAWGDGSMPNIQGAVEVPNPPENAAGFLWDGGSWVQSVSAANKERNAIRLAQLAELDAKSVRGLREFLVAKFGADPLLPAAVKTHETAAKAARDALEP